jgi:hypothetical protein
MLKLGMLKSSTSVVILQSTQASSIHFTISNFVIFASSFVILSSPLAMMSNLNGSPTIFVVIFPSFKLLMIEPCPSSIALKLLTTSTSPFFIN